MKKYSNFLKNLIISTDLCSTVTNLAFKDFAKSQAVSLIFLGAHSPSPQI
jgi:hypothetical protein